MTRISAYIIIPCIATCLSFGTEFFGLFVLTLIVFSLINFIRRKNVALSLIMLVVTLIFSISASNIAAIANKDFYPFVGKRITLTCMVDETPVTEGNEIRFCARMISINSKGAEAQVSGKVQVRVKGATENLNYGDKISFRTVLSIPPGNDIKGEFNYQNYLQSRGIQLICNTYDFLIENHGSYEKVNPIILRIFRIRDKLLNKCDVYFGHDLSAFVKALMLGYKTDMPEDMTDYISRSGISHVVAVSGLHLSAIMMIASFLLERIKFRGSKFVTPTASIIIALLVMCITGFSPSVKRASAMLIVSNITTMIRRENDPLQSLSIALIILLALNPFALGDIRLSLSVAAVLGIILFVDKTEHLLRFIRLKYIRSCIAVSIAAQILALPLIVYYFNSVSLVSIFTNIVVVPIIPYIMGTGIAFLAMPFDVLSGFLSNGIWLSTKFILDFAKFMASVPYGYITLNLKELIYTASLITIVFVLTAKTLTSDSTKKNLLRTGVSVIAIVLLFFPPESGDFKITALTTGNGDRTLIEFPEGKTMLLSNPNSNTYEASEEAVSKRLIKNGVRRIDYAVLSFPNEKETNCIQYLSESVHIGCIIIPDYNAIHPALINLSNEKGIPIYAMKSGDMFRAGKNSSVEVLSPDARYSYDKENGSLVLKVSSNGKSFLFTGNIGYYTKTILTNHMDLKSHILQIPNHGEYTAADMDFIKKVDPEGCILSTESTYRKNPDIRTLWVYSDMGIPISRTDLDGAARFTFPRP